MNRNIQVGPRTGTNIEFCRTSNFAGRSVSFFGMLGGSGPNRVTILSRVPGAQEDSKVLAPDDTQVTRVKSLRTTIPRVIRRQVRLVSTTTGACLLGEPVLLTTLSAIM